MDNKCEKCNRNIRLVLIEKGEIFTTEIWKCTNPRCGYMFRVLKTTK